MKPTRKLTEMDFAVLAAVCNGNEYPKDVCTVANRIGVALGLEGAPYTRSQTERSCNRLLKRGRVLYTQLKNGHWWTPADGVEEHGLYRCCACRGTNVLMTYWVDCNRMEITEKHDVEGPWTRWCVDCHEHTNIEHITIAEALHAAGLNTDAKKAS